MDSSFPSLALIEFRLYISLTLAEPLEIILDFDYCCCYLLLYLLLLEMPPSLRKTIMWTLFHDVIYVASTSAWSVHQTSELSIECVLSAALVFISLVFAWIYETCFA